MRRNELSPQATTELAALDSILAREPVGEEHLELAALVDSVRADAPRMSDAFAARLETSVTSPRQRRAAGRRRAGAPRFAMAGGSLFALVLVAVAVVSSGVLNGTRQQLPVAVPTTARHLPSSGFLNATAEPNTPKTPHVVQGTASAGASVAPTPLLARPQVRRDTNPNSRLVARSASLTLATAASQMQSVANQVVASTEQFGGIVEHSNVAVHGLSSYSTFSLSVPSAKLPQLIASLSSLAGVRSLTQGTSDITDRYNQAQATLADQKAERAALIKELAAATTLAQETSIQQKITRLDREIAAETGRVGALLTKGHNASIAVSIVATKASAGTGIGGSGPVGRALRDALRVLDVALAIALVAFAIMLPLMLTGLATWWAAGTLRRRSREQAFDAAAS
jgi:Domain of unknown function (DUF4349)